MGAFDAAARANQLSRRQVLKLSGLAATGLVGSVLLAACGSDDDDPTATAGGGDTTGTSAGTEPTATTAAGDATATMGGGEATPTSTDAEPSPTTGSDPATPSGATSQKNYGSVTPEPAENEGGTLILGWYDLDGVSMNPLYYFHAWEYLHFVFEPLVTLQTNEPIPVLATGWETSDDGLTWTFTLREGVTFHDGEPFTADDVVFTYQAHTAEDSVSFERQVLIDNVASVEATDPMTVTMQAVKATPEFITHTVHFIVPEHVYSQVPLADMATHPVSAASDPAWVVGTGAFRFVELIVGDHLTYQRYDGYWAGPAYLEEIVVQPFVDTQVALSSLLAGDVDITWMTEPDAAGLAGNPDFEALAGTRTGMDFIHFNLEPERSPLLGDIRVRHALAYGLDRENLVDAIYSGYAEVAETLIPQPLWSSNPEGVTVRYPYDPEQAMALLEEAGWTVGSDGIREKDGQRLALVMLKYIDSTSDLLFSIAQENWRLIGVELTPDGREPAGIDEAYYQGFDFETVFMGTLWFSGSGFGSFEWVAACDMYPDGGNRVMYCNEEFDALLEQVATTFDEEERVELFTQMQNIFLEDMSLLPVAHHQRVFGTNKRTHNVVMGQEIATYYANTWWVEA